MGITNVQRGRQVFRGGIELNRVRYVVDGAIDANATHWALLEKPSAGTWTLAAPLRDGLRIDIISRTAFSHVVNAPGLLDEGTPGGSKNKITFAVAKGASVGLMSADGAWNVVTLLGANVGN